MIHTKSEKKGELSIFIKTISIAVILFTVLSCKNNDKKSTKVITEEDYTAVSLESGCYIYDKNDNLINFEILSTDNPVKGNLTYSFREKDKNTGQFIGEIKENKLIGTYTFLSEGVESQREVAFLIKENQLIEGYGDLDETGTKFLNRSNIDYTSTMPLTKKNCR